MQDVAGRVLAAEQRQAELGDASRCDASSVVAAGKIVAEKEECRTVVLEMQQLAKRLSKVDLKKMAESFGQDGTACISTSGSPLSMVHPDTWPKCFLEFFYGDALPVMHER